jgi:hypothetical protein
LSDISLEGLNGLVVAFGLWLLAGGYFIAAMAFGVASLRTGNCRAAFCTSWISCL